MLKLEKKNYFSQKKSCAQRNISLFIYILLASQVMHEIGVKILQSSFRVGRKNQVPYITMPVEFITFSLFIAFYINTPIMEPKTIDIFSISAFSFL